MGLRNGFTLTETLIVMGFTVAVGAFAAVSLFGWREQKQVSATAQQIAATLREAESRAISQSKGTKWGVRFGNSQGGSYYALFYGDMYDPSARVSYHSLPSSIAYDIIHLPEGEFLEIVFNQVDGRPTLYDGTIDGSRPRAQVASAPGGGGGLTLNISARGSDEGDRPTSSISVSTLGLITFDVFRCAITCIQTTTVLPPPPTLTLAANPSMIVRGASTTLTWSSGGANSCGASWTASTKTSGTEDLRPTQTDTYSMACVGDGGNATASVVIDVIEPPPSGGGSGGGSGPGGSTPKQLK